MSAKTGRRQTQFYSKRMSGFSRALHVGTPLERFWGLRFVLLCIGLRKLHLDNILRFIRRTVNKNHDACRLGARIHRYITLLHVKGDKLLLLWCHARRVGEREAGWLWTFFLRGLFQNLSVALLRFPRSFTGSVIDSFVHLGVISLVRRNLFFFCLNFAGLRPRGSGKRDGGDALLLFLLLNFRHLWVCELRGLSAAHYRE
mmetsp:Transcript_26672/g.54604  ORF Transcript_26672/g.54604 Transcript_26672/m.54604 type:complete len:201 (+) Transcript_26672:108-710(+)